MNWLLCRIGFHDFEVKHTPWEYPWIRRVCRRCKHFRPT